MLQCASLLILGPSDGRGFTVPGFVGEKDIRSKVYFVLSGDRFQIVHAHVMGVDTPSPGRRLELGMKLWLTKGLANYVLFSRVVNTAPNSELGSSSSWFKLVKDLSFNHVLKFKSCSNSTNIVKHIKYD